MKTIDLNRIYRSYFGTFSTKIDAQTQQRLTLQQLSLILAHIMNEDEALYANRKEYYHLFYDQLSIHPELIDFVLAEIEKEMLVNELTEIIENNPSEISNGYLFATNNQLNLFRNHLIDDRHYLMDQENQVVENAIGVSWATLLDEVTSKQNEHFFEIELAEIDELELFNEDVLRAQCSNWLKNNNCLTINEAAVLLQQQRNSLSISFVIDYYEEYLTDKVLCWKLIHSNISMN